MWARFVAVLFPNNAFPTRRRTASSGTARRRRQRPRNSTVAGDDRQAFAGSKVPRHRAARQALHSRRARLGGPRSVFNPVGALRMHASCWAIVAVTTPSPTIRILSDSTSSAGMRSMETPGPTAAPPSSTISFATNTSTCSRKPGCATTRFAPTLLCKPHLRTSGSKAWATTTRSPLGDLSKESLRRRPQKLYACWSRDL